MWYCGGRGKVKSRGGGGGGGGVTYSRSIDYERIKVGSSALYRIDILVSLL